MSNPNMKVVFPKHIKRWILSWMNFNIWPITVSVVQLFVMAVGISISLAIFNVFTKAGSKFLWILFAVIVLIIFVIITFFKISELTLIPFLAKVVRNKFFDTNEKFQVNYEKSNPLEIIIKESKSEIETAQIEKKINLIDQDMLNKIEKWWLL